MWEGPRHPCGFTSAGSSYYKMWAGLDGFDPRNDLALGGVRIGMGCNPKAVGSQILPSVWQSDLTCIMEFNACHDKGQCGWVLGEGLNFQLHVVKGPQRMSFRPFSKGRSTLTQTFLESCVDFEVAINQYSWFGDGHTGDSYLNEFTSRFERKAREWYLNDLCWFLSCS